jgi:hypothetical protein
VDWTGPSVKEDIFRAIRRSGAIALVVPSENFHSDDFIAVENGKTIHIRVFQTYLVDDSHGTDYFFIPPKGSFSHSDLNDNGPTVLIGYECMKDVFIGINLERLIKNGGNAEKIRIPGWLVDEAQVNGIAFGVKTGDGNLCHPMEFRKKSEKESSEDIRWEKTKAKTSKRNAGGDTQILVAFTPEHFLHFTGSTSSWFSYTDVNTVEAMYLSTTAAALTEEEIHSLSEKRAKMVRTIYVWVRDSSFSRRVLKAYEYKCAITGLQLELPVAAHIMPVASGVKNDSVSNGISLSPTFHAALDDGLIYFAYEKDGTLRLKKNGKRSGYLRYRKWVGEAEMVLSYTLIDNGILKKYMPKDRDNWPDVNMIEEGNKWRGIAE